MVLIGESQGGFVSAMAAAELGDTISSLVLIYPALCIPDNWNSRYKTEAEIPDTTKVWNVPIGQRFFKELRDIDVYGKITDYRGPVQIIHGSKDPVVPVEYSEEAMKKYHNAHIGVIPGAGHGFKPDERAVSNRFVKEFLENSNRLNRHNAPRGGCGEYQWYRFEGYDTCVEAEGFGIGYTEMPRAVVKPQKTCLSSATAARR